MKTPSSYIEYNCKKKQTCHHCTCFIPEKRKITSIFSKNKKKDPENILGMRKRSTIVEEIKLPIISSILKDLTNKRKKTCMVKVFTHTTLPSVFLKKDHCSDILTIRLNLTSDYFTWKFRLTLHQNHHGNKTRTRRPREIKGVYEFLNHFGKYRDIFCFKLVLRG